jgi:hypothetical protein
MNSMMDARPRVSDITEVLHKAIHREIEKIITEQSQNIAGLVEKQVRERIGSLAAVVARNVSFQSFGDRLTITVYFPGGGTEGGRVC